MTVTLYTLGHSNRALETLITLLRDAEIAQLVDVRAYPVSRRYPHFSQAVLQAAVEEAGMIYSWAGRELGGRRKPAGDSRHAALANEGLRGFADYMESERFRAAARQLVEAAAAGVATAIMCAERLPKHCHRALIADYLSLVAGIEVVHLSTTDERRPHRPDVAARVHAGCVIYDRLHTPALDI